MESLVSPIQRLSFNSLMSKGDKRGRYVWDPARVHTPDGEYNNLALILSDQCPWHCVVIGDDMTETVVRGSVVDQIPGVQRAVDRVRRRMAEMSGGEMSRYPGMVLNEVLLNALSHRSYCSDSPVTVRVHRDRIEVVSPGGMMRLGVSHRDRSRNPMLTEMLGDIGFKNTSVCGLQDVNKAYRNC